MLLRNILRSIPSMSSFILPKIYRPICKLQFHKSQYKANLQQQLLQYASNIPQSISSEDFTELVTNYIQLTQSSFADYIKTVDPDPQLLLMLLSTFQDHKRIREFLPYLYHKINYLQKRQMVHLLQKILAFKPTTKPKIPHPRALEDIQSVLVLMSELYNADLLVQWIKFVPVYQGNSIYLLTMGYFAILQKMSPEIKEKNRNILIKCHKKMCKYLEDQSLDNNIRIGIILLALQLNYKQSMNLFLMADLDFTLIDASKKMLFIINITRYFGKEKLLVENIEEQQEDVHNLKFIRKKLDQLILEIVRQDYGGFIKLMKAQIFKQLWKSIYEYPKLTGPLLKLSEKLAKVAKDKQFAKQIKKLNIEDLVVILECMEKHKINNQQLLKRILIFISPHLYHMDKTLFMRTLKCLVTYVRQCQDYLINCRKVLQERKLQFSEKQAQQINQILRRVMILFPKPFKVSN